MAGAALAEAVGGPVHRRGEGRHVAAHAVRQLLCHGQRDALLEVENVCLELPERINEVCDCMRPQAPCSLRGGGSVCDTDRNERNVSLSLSLRRW